MSTVITKALLEGIGQDEKDRVIAQAVAFLGQPRERDRYSSAPPKTPLQEAFDQALNQYVNKVVREFIESNDEVQTAVREQLSSLLNAYHSQLSDNYDLGPKVAEAIGNYFVEKAQRY